MRNFNGIFRCPNLPLLRIDIAQQGMQGRRLARPGRPNAQNDPVRFLGDALEGVDETDRKIHAIQRHEFFRT